MAVHLEIVRRLDPAARARRTQFKAGEHRQQASSKGGDLARLGTLQGLDTNDEVRPNRVVHNVMRITPGNTKVTVGVSGESCPLARGVLFYG